LENPPRLKDGTHARVEVEKDGAWLPSSTAGILKPAVVMFGENIDTGVKSAAEEAIDDAGRLLILGSSLATYSAWRLVERAHRRVMPIAIINLGGVRNESVLFGTSSDVSASHVRCSFPSEAILPPVVSLLRSFNYG
jgi:NAD-dependent SIR2 family protein deacetylase